MLQGVLVASGAGGAATKMTLLAGNRCMTLLADNRCMTLLADNLWGFSGQALGK